MLRRLVARVSTRTAFVAWRGEDGIQEAVHWLFCELIAVEGWWMVDEGSQPMSGSSEVHTGGLTCKG